MGQKNPPEHVGEEERRGRSRSRRPSAPQLRKAVARRRLEELAEERRLRESLYDVFGDGPD